MPTTTTIAVDKESKESLNKLGRKGETYNEIIKKLIELAKREKFFKKQERILEEEEFVNLDEL